MQVPILPFISNKISTLPQTCKNTSIFKFLVYIIENNVFLGAPNINLDALQALASILLMYATGTNIAMLMEATKLIKSVDRIRL